MSPMALSMKPTGWFQVGWSADLEAGDVKPLRYFGQDLVAYRTQGGRFVVLNAYCEHLGAHLGGHGGSVAGDDITCPFHGWQWSPEGRNTCIPYQKATNRVRKIGTWPTAERDGIMYIWHDVDGGDPLYEVPSIFDMFPGSGSANDYHDLGESGRLETAELPIHPQYAAENGVDFAHFKYVHRADEVPTVVSREFGEYDFKTELALNFKRRSVDGGVENITGRTRALLLGLGLGFSHADGVVHLLTDSGDPRRRRALDPAVLHVGEQGGRRGRISSGEAAAQRDRTGQGRHRNLGTPALHRAARPGDRRSRRLPRDPEVARRFYPPEGTLGHGAAEQTAGTDELQAEYT